MFNFTRYLLTRNVKGKLAIRYLTLRVVFCLSAQVTAQSTAAESPLLQLGQSVERTLEREQTHAYRFALAAGQVTQIVVEHHQQDVVVTVFDAAIKLLPESFLPHICAGSVKRSLRILF